MVVGNIFNDPLKIDKRYEIKGINFLYNYLK
jgi:hypothetical protein